MPDIPGLMPGTTKLEASAQLLRLTGITLIALFLFQLIGIWLTSLIYGYDTAAIGDFLTNKEGATEGKNAILFMQGVISIGTFLLAPTFFLQNIGQPQETVYLPENFTLSKLLLIPVLILAASPIISLTQEWNAGITFPSELSDLYQKLKLQEEQLEALTISITKIDGIADAILIFTIVAIIPALGEELLFRGLLQPRLTKITGSHHVGIWLTAFIFGFIHFQFFGLIPRTILGALLGYVYFYSGSLWLAVFMHFLNNGLTLIIINALGADNFNESTFSQGYNWLVIFPALAIVVGLLLHLRKTSLFAKSSEPWNG